MLLVWGHCLDSEAILYNGLAGVRVECALACGQKKSASFPLRLLSTMAPLFFLHRLFRGGHAHIYHVCFQFFVVVLILSCVPSMFVL